MVANDTLKAFGEAVRTKSCWEIKILDKERNLGVKWAVEAHLLKTDTVASQEEPSDDEKKVLEYIKELEAEARRIVYFDHTPHLTPRSPITRPDYDFEEFRTEAAGFYKFLKASRYAVCPADLREDVGVFVSDDVVPASLHSALVAELDRLASLEPKDLHPGSGGKVQDIIHPSLYPYKLNSTPLSTGTSRHNELDGLRFESSMENSAGASLEYSSPYAWLPSVFRVSEDGTSVEIQSYINGLGPRERHPALYNTIEQIFVVVMPLLEQTTEFEFEYCETPSEARWMQRNLLRQDVHDDRVLRTELEGCIEEQAAEKKEEQELFASEKRHRDEQAALERTRFEDFRNIDTSDARLESSFAGKDLKVIVKAANYILQPGESYEGSWHVEGMPHERIVASAIYYYDTDATIIDKGLSLRRMRNEFKDFPKVDVYMSRDFYYTVVDEISDENTDGESVDDDPSDWGEEDPSETIMLGTVPTTNIGPAGDLPKTGRILTFPNWIQHKVAGLQNDATAAEAGRRKILCFFLVDDDFDTDEEEEEDASVDYYAFSYTFKAHRVLTTADVPYQARGCNFPTLHILLPLVSERLIGKRLPAEVVEMIINSDDDHHFPGRGGALGMSWKEAEATRRAVMDDRRARDGRWESLPEFSLCEH